MKSIEAQFAWLRPPSRSRDSRCRARSGAGIRSIFEDGAVPCENNWVENQIRPIAIGRSNWLFAGSLRAGKRAAAVMSLIHSARLKRPVVDPSSGRVLLEKRKKLGGFDAELFLSRLKTESQGLGFEFETSPSTDALTTDRAPKR